MNEVIPFARTKLTLNGTESQEEEEDFLFLTNQEKRVVEMREKAFDSSRNTRFDVTELLDESRNFDNKSLSWILNFPLSIYKCRDICQMARYMPKSLVMSYVFIGEYSLLSDQEKDFADKMYDFGRAFGVKTVGKELYDGAASGDPRAVKMYLELMRLLDDDSGTDALDGLLKVMIDIK